MVFSRCAIAIGIGDFISVAGDFSDFGNGVKVSRKLQENQSYAQNYFVQCMVARMTTIINQAGVSHRAP